MTFPSRLLIVVAVMASSGCAHVYYTRTANYQPRASRSPATVEIFLQERPKRPYESVGTIESARYQAGEGIDAIRNEAAMRGLDGVFDVYCAPPGTVGWGNCSGTAFLWK